MTVQEPKYVTIDVRTIPEIRDLLFDVWEQGMVAGHACVGTEPRPECLDANPFRGDYDKEED